MSLRVLVADDSSAMRKLHPPLAGGGRRRAGDGSGRRGRSRGQVQAGEFDLVLTDWNMPGKTGLEVIQEIRVQDAQVKIMMVTTEAEKTRVAQAIEAGATDYLIKPFTADLLRKSCRSTVSSRKVRAQPHRSIRADA